MKAEPIASYPGLRTHRGRQVAWSGASYPPPYRPVVSVELSTKWYGVQLVGTTGANVELPFPNDPDPLFDTPCGAVPWVDHVPNPASVAAWAKRMGYDVDELAMDLMVGRWVREVEGRDP